MLSAQRVKKESRVFCKAEFQLDPDGRLELADALLDALRLLRHGEPINRPPRTTAVVIKDIEIIIEFIVFLLKSALFDFPIPQR